MRASPGQAPDILSYLSEKRDAIRIALADIVRRRGADLSACLPDGDPLMARLADFTAPGKMIRGALVFLGHELFAPIENDAARTVVAVASAMELFQSGLLIHDDIMDRDEIRRGQPTMHRAYANRAAVQGIADADHAGEAMAMCAADAAFFAGFGELAECGANPSVIARLVALCGRELSLVAFAQMRDVEWGAAHWAAARGAEAGKVVPESDVLAMYRHKTARYTFSLPLVSGALLAGRADATEVLGAAGEHAGVAFQLRDDELGLFGDAARLGKPVGSDVREGKKTVLYARLMAAASEEDRVRLRSIFGRSDATEADIANVRELAEYYGVRHSLAQTSANAAAEARTLVKTMGGISPRPLALLEDLLDYVVERSS